MESIYFAKTMKIATSKRIISCLTKECIKLQIKSCMKINWNERKQISRSSVFYLTRSSAAAAGPMFGCCACVRVYCSPRTFSRSRISSWVVQSHKNLYLHKGDRILIGTTPQKCTLHPGTKPRKACRHWQGEQKQYLKQTNEPTK